MSKSAHEIVPAQSKTRTAPFQDKHIIEFALKVTQRDVKTGKVCAVCCQFCSFGGREELPGQKRQRMQTTNDKIWESFRKEYYRKHHSEQHSTRWEEYKLLSSAEKEAYFIGKTQYKDTIPNHFGQTNTHIIFNISSPIVEKVIGKMFFHSDDQGGITQERALKLFIQNDDGDGYTVTIKNPLQFRLVVQYLAKGLSFRQVEEVFLVTKQLTGITSVRSR